MLAFTVGVLAWFIPLVMITGGPRAYWAVLSFQGVGGRDEHSDPPDPSQPARHRGRVVLRLHRTVGDLADRGRRPSAGGARVRRARVALVSNARDHRRGVRTLLRVRPALSGDVHEPLRAAARDSGRVSRRHGRDALAVAIRRDRRDRGRDGKRARRRHIGRGLRPRKSAGVSSARRHARRRRGGEGPARAGDGSQAVVRFSPADDLGGRRLAAVRRDRCPLRRSTNGSRR